MKSSRMEITRHELLTDVEEQVRMILSEHKIDAALAEQCGCAIANHLAQHWGGQHITIPMDYHYQLSQRDIEIWEAFDGRNHAALARQFHLSVNAIYRILKRTSQKAIQRYQDDMFSSQ